ncbi:MAG: hypothetical protein IKI93_15760 [Clostridia bacterium]|nr:hypothetical protein [Clostridia bacterium]
MGVINAHFSKREAVRQYGKKYLDRQYRWKDNLRTLALQKLFPDYFTGFRNLHAPAAYLKKSFQEVWEAEPELLDTTSCDKFRTAANVNQWVCLWWQIAGGNFMPGNVDNIVMSVTEDSIDTFSQIIRQQQHDMICINDPDNEVDFAILSAKLHEAFEVILPEKSSFEK